MPLKVSLYDIFKNKDGSFMLIYFYPIKTLIFHFKFIAYVDVSLQEGRGRKKSENSWFSTQSDWNLSNKY